MSVLSQAAIVRAGRALNELTQEQRNAITGAWVNPGYRASVTAGIEPKLVSLALAVIDYYSDMPFAELEELRTQDDPVVLALRAQLAEVKHELEVAHRYAELLDAKNGVLRTSMAHTQRVAREVDTDFIEMRADLSTQF